MKSILSHRACIGAIKNPSLTPPRRGTGHATLHPSWEGSGVGLSPIVSFLRAEAIDAPVVRTDDNFAVHHRRRTADRLADFVRPKFVAVLERHDVNPAIIRPDDHFIADHDR